MSSNLHKCQCVTHNNQQCTRLINIDQTYCWQHKNCQKPISGSKILKPQPEIVSKIAESSAQTIKDHPIPPKTKLKGYLKVPKQNPPVFDNSIQVVEESHQIIPEAKFKILDNDYYLNKIRSLAPIRTQTINDLFMNIDKIHSVDPKRYYKEFYDRGHSSPIYQQKIKDLNLLIPCRDSFCAVFPQYKYKCQNMDNTIPESLFQTMMETTYFIMEAYNRNINIKNLSPPQICQEYEQQLPSVKWLSDQFTYLNNLPPEDQNILQFYSLYGDRLINMFCRNHHQVNADMLNYVISEEQVQGFSLAKPKNFSIFEPTLKQVLGYKISKSHITLDLLQTYCQALVNNLNQIIMKSPKTHKDMIVFRGTTKNYYMTGLGDIYANNGFVSTTLRSYVALGFSGPGFDFKYMSLIQIPAGYPCLLHILSQFPYEAEILLPDQSKYKVLGRFTPKEYIVDEYIGFELHGSSVYTKGYLNSQGEMVRAETIGDNTQIMSIPTNQVRMMI